MLLTSLLVIVLCIYLLAIVTDEFFIVSLEQISERLKLPKDVAGASLMAMGSSAPELAIALLALFKGGGEHSELGIGTIVGSAVFNILIITGVSAIARPAHITWNVIVRDMMMYVMSIALLLLSFADGTISLLEAITFVGFYGAYIVILINWKTEVIEEKEAVMVSAEISPASPTTILQKLNHLVGKALGLFMGNPETSYIRAFLVSIGFVALISWFLVEYALELATALNIPPVIIALTVLAGGTSIPDMIGSIVVARKGHGDMAIANAIGSNIFDILIGLGVPWVLAIALAGGDTLHVGTGSIWTSAMILLSTVLLLFVFLTTGRKLDKREGWVLVFCYVGYITWVWMGTA